MTELAFSQLSWMEFEELIAALAKDADDLAEARITEKAASGSTALTSSGSPGLTGAPTRTSASG